MQSKLSLVITALLLVTACSHKPVLTTSSDAQKDLQAKYTNQIGTATKEDFIQEFGPANWCRDESGEQTCRFYKKIKTEWMGQPPTDRVHRETFDEVVATFDTNGNLKTFKATAQR